MRLEYIGLSELSGSLIALEGVKDVAYDEMAEVTLENGERRYGRVILIDGDRVVLQVFEGTRGISLENASTHFTGKSMDIALSKEMLGRVFDGAGRPIDALGEIYPEERRNINGSAINPVSRKYPRSCIYTGISAIDGCATLIRGQKLPIFSGSGMKHNELAVQIVRQASVADGSDFAIVFAAMGVKNDVASYFRESFESCGAMERVVMLLNLANDPIIERIITPRAALTVAEYLAFDLNKNVLVILTDMTSYCEALREFSSSKGENPGPQGLPRLPVFRSGQPVRARRHHQGQQGLCDPDPDPDHARRRHYPPDPDLTATSPRGRSCWTAAWMPPACIRLCPCCPACPV